MENGSNTIPIVWSCYSLEYFMRSKPLNIGRTTALWKKTQMGYAETSGWQRERDLEHTDIAGGQSTSATPETLTIMDKTFWNTIRADLFRHEGRSGAWDFARTLRCPGFRFTVVLRICSRLKASTNIFGRIASVPARLLLRHYSMKFGFQIPAATQIGDGLFINHWGSIVINPCSVIGNNVNLHPGTTIGQANRGNRKGCPTIGNSVWIGANCVIVGRITIGDNVLIAPGSYINFDIPDNAVVAGNPATIRSYDRVDAYIEKVVEFK